MAYLSSMSKVSTSSGLGLYRLLNIQYSSTQLSGSWRRAESWVRFTEGIRARSPRAPVSSWGGVLSKGPAVEEETSRYYM